MLSTAVYTVHLHGTVYLSDEIFYKTLCQSTSNDHSLLNNKHFSNSLTNFYLNYSSTEGSYNVADVHKQWTNPQCLFELFPEAIRPVFWKDVGKSFKSVRTDREVYETNIKGVLVPEEVENSSFEIHRRKTHIGNLLSALDNALTSLRFPKRHEISCPAKRLLATKNNPLHVVS